MSDRYIKEFLGFSELREGNVKDQPGKKVIYLKLLYAGGNFPVQASNSFEIDNSTGVPALKHIPTGKIFRSNELFIGVMEGTIINATAYKRQMDLFGPKVLVNFEPVSGASPLPKMEEKKNK